MPRKKSDSQAKNGVKIYSLSVSYETDSDMIAWLESIRAGFTAHAIREAIESYEPYIRFKKSLGSHSVAPKKQLKAEQRPVQDSSQIESKVDSTCHQSSQKSVSKISDFDTKSVKNSPQKPEQVEQTANNSLTNLEQDATKNSATQQPISEPIQSSVRLPLKNGLVNWSVFILWLKEKFHGINKTFKSKVHA